MVTISRARHQFDRCPCGHHQHRAAGVLAKTSTGPTSIGTKEVIVISCEECERIEKAEGVTLAFVETSYASKNGIHAGAFVHLDRTRCAVKRVTPITKLNGGVKTRYSVVALQAVRV